ncbi:MAG: biotin transporter BioY [Elusimicrobia bacterium]|nr:biotin transporter BioY [Elusimicrobiota bacterium]
MSDTIVLALSPSDKKWLRLVQVLGFSLFIAACAQIEISLWTFTPVPITGQTLGVLMTGALLGRRWGVIAVLTYLIEGSLGLPFFAGGASGAHFLLGPTGGYLLGFLPAAWVVGRFAQAGWDRDPFTAALMMGIGSSIILLCGLVGLARFFPLNQLLSIGVYPFLGGDIIKICLGAALLPFGWKLVPTSKKR